MIFVGMSEWEPGEPLVELQVDGQLVDLHGFGWFEGFEYRVPERLLLRFQYDEGEAKKLGWGADNHVELLFEGVSNLRVKTDPHPVILEPDALIHWVYYPEESGENTGTVEFVFGDGLTLDFRCGAVTYRTG